jgi:hypothetical protein
MEKGKMDLECFIDYYLSEGLSVIPVREQAEFTRSGKEKGVKTPKEYSWKYAQENVSSKSSVLQKLYAPNSAPAIVGGAVSGNLEVIDIDTKNWHGIDALYLQEVKSIYPEIYSKLRIHRTPSGGCHLYYKCTEFVGQSQKLAKKNGAQEYAIETRGEGGYAVAPPAIGYTVINAVPIPVITKAQRDGLIELAKCFDETVKQVVVARPLRMQDSMYDENPFEAFNKSQEAELVLQRNGWKIYQQSKNFTHYTRPGKSSNTSASFIHDKGLYHFFTSSSEFQPDRTYSPASVMCVLEFQNNYKDLYRHLIDQGYGKLKKTVERSMIKKAAAAGKSLPKNVSDEAHQAYENEVRQAKEDFPHGIFWDGDIQDGYEISIQRILDVSKAFNYYVHDSSQLCHIVGHIVKKVDNRQLFDQLKEYIREDEERNYVAICDAFERHIQKYGKYIVDRLEVLPVDKFLRSNYGTSYKFYKNCILQITKDNITTLDYSFLDGQLIWDTEEIDRDFKKVPSDEMMKSVYLKYLNLAIGLDKNECQIQRVLGYLAHPYKDETMGYIITLVEEVEDPKDGGGSGKNLFAKLLENVTTFKEVSGNQVHSDERFLQQWDGQRIYALADLPKKFDFSFLKNLSSNSGTLKKLFKNEVSIDSRDMPKIVVSTNFSFQNSDGGLKRRIIPVEFTDYFTKHGGVKEVFGKYFTTDWDDTDWNGFDNYIAICIKEWLTVLKLKAPELSETGFWKQFVTNYNQHVKDYIDDNIEDWTRLGKCESGKISEQFKDYARAANISHIASAQTLNNAIQDYCAFIGYHFEKSKVIKVMNVPTRFSIFTKNEQEKGYPADWDVKVT